MPSKTKENYIKAIYFLEEKSREISLSALSREMKVSAPTANNMVKNLQDLGWIRYKKYKPLKLTDEGRQAAIHIIRKHRLTEMFLTEKMGFGWEEVHHIAEDMEHIRSEKLFDRMDELLGNPEVDPHGSPIPDKTGHVDKKDYLRLSDVSEGNSVLLKSLARSSEELMLYLNRKEITLGTKLKVLSIEPFDLSLMVAYNEHNSVMLSREVCERLEVELI